MTSAYGGAPGTGTLGVSALSYLPLVTVLSRFTTQPYTLHPTPYTLRPTPYTLHPTPCTFSLNPEP